MSVRTVDAESGRPVAGAVVRFHSEPVEAEALGAAQRELRRRDPWTWLESIDAPSVLTDQDGLAELPADLPAQHVLAQAGELFGTRWSAPSFGEIDELVIELARDWICRIRVVDAADRPVDAATVVGLATDAPPGKKPDLSVLGRTGPDGLLVIPHAQTSRLLGGTYPVGLRATAVGAKGGETILDPSSRPSIEHVLRMPATGSVTVRVVGLDGRDLDPQLLPWSRVDLEPDPGPPGRTIVWNRKLEGANEVHFQHVGLGLQLKARLRHFRETIDAGPQQPGEHVVLTLREPGGAPVVTGSLRFANGRPVGEGLCRMDWQAVSGATGGVRVQIGPEGRYRVRLDAEVLGAGPVAATIHDTRRNAERPWRADLVIRSFDEGVHDLGPLVVREPALLATGRLQGIDEIDPQAVRGSLALRSTTSGEPVDDHPSQLAATRITFAEDATFEVHGFCRDGLPLDLNLDGSGFWQRGPFAFETGDRDLVVPVEAAHEFAVAFVLDDAHTRAALDCRLEPLGDDTGRRPIRREDWTIRDPLRPVAWFTDIPGGSWRLVLQNFDLREEVLVEGPLEFGDGRSPTPPTLDLRSRLRTVWIHASDALGRPLGEQGVVCTERADGRIHARRFEAGRAPLVLSGPRDVWVLADDHRLATLEGVEGHRTIALQSASRVEALLACDQPWPEGIDIEFRLAPRNALPIRLTAGTHHGVAFAPWQQIGPENSVVVVPACLGPQRAHLRLSLGRRRKAVECGELEIDATTTRIRVVVPAEPLREAIEELRRD